NHVAVHHNGPVVTGRRRRDCGWITKCGENYAIIQGNGVITPRLFGFAGFVTTDTDSQGERAVHHTSRSTVFAASLTAAFLVLTACAPQEGGGGATDGLADCAEHPNTCNSGERADGGDITWIVDSLPGAWATLSPEGGSVYTLQMLHGTLPHTGHWEPDGATFTPNLDLLAEEPR